MSQTDPIRLMLVDDHPIVLNGLRNVLEASGHFDVVGQALDGVEAVRTAQAVKPEVIVMDVIMPEKDGIDACREIMGLLPDTRVLMLTASTEEDAVIQAIAAGAAGHPQAGPAEPYVLGDLTIDYTQRLVTVAGRPVQTTATEYRILHELSLNSGQVLTHDQLLRRIWGANRPDNLQALRTHLRRLRRKLGDDGSNPTYLFAEPRSATACPEAQGRMVGVRDGLRLGQLPGYAPELNPVEGVQPASCRFRSGRPTGADLASRWRSFRRAQHPWAAGHGEDSSVVDGAIVGPALSNGPSAQDTARGRRSTAVSFSERPPPP